jgi:hypothetical protein
MLWSSRSHVGVKLPPPAIVGHFDQQRGWIAYHLIELIAESSRAPSGAQCSALGWNYLTYTPYR